MRGKRAETVGVDALGLEPSAGPPLLGFDDRDALAVDQDRVWRAFDLGLLVAQLGDEPVGVVGTDATGQRAATRNQRLAVIKSFCRYTAVEQPENLD
jgi:hypothetical protein